jgi:hypothetical protein
MMDQDRNLGVTETRFALTLVICLLVAVGYVVLLRLGGSGESAVERVENLMPPEIVQIEPKPVNANDPEVLKIEPPQTTESRMSTRPGRTPPAGSVDSGDPQRR